MSEAVRTIEEAAEAPWDKPRFDVVLLFAMLLLVGLGVVMVYSSSAMYAASKNHDPFFFLKRQAFFALLGAGAMSGMIRLGYQRLRRLSGPLVLLCLVLVVATIVPGLGVKMNGSSRWLRLPGFQFQPTELLKVVVCIWIAKLAGDKGREAMGSFREGLVPIGTMLLVLSVPVMLQPDFGTTVVLWSVVGIVILASGGPLKLATGIAGLGAVAVYVLVKTSPYRLKRVEAFLNPFADRHGIGYQVAEAMMSFGSGGWTGQGLGRGPQKLGFLPEGHTDYILASIGEELGFVGVASVLGLYAVIVWRGMRAVREARDAFGAHLAFAITSLFAIETFINAGMCLHLLPSKGLALPFVSYGGTSLVKAMAAGGILLSISGGGGGASMPARPLGAVR
jgi:cell division protein FtsW